MTARALFLRCTQSPRKCAHSKSLSGTSPMALARGQKNTACDCAPPAREASHDTEASSQVFHIAIGVVKGLQARRASIEAWLVTPRNCCHRLAFRRAQQPGVLPCHAIIMAGTNPALRFWTPKPHSPNLDQQEPMSLFLLIHRDACPRLRAHAVDRGSTPFGFGREPNPTCTSSSLRFGSAGWDIRVVVRPWPAAALTTSKEFANRAT